MKKLIKITALIIFCIFVSYQIVYSADEALVVPHVFVFDTVAKASEMNEMFAAIQSILNSNLVTMFDYGSPDNATRTFDNKGSDIVITNTPGMETWSYSDGHKVEHLTAEGAEGIMEIGRREYNTSGVMTQDLTYFPAFQGVDLWGPKEIGKTWGGAWIAKKPDGSIYGAETKLFTILAIETVTVPAGTFADCIKVYVENNYTAVSWYAEGVGMVMRIGVNGLMELK